MRDGGKGVAQRPRNPPSWNPASLSIKILIGKIDDDVGTLPLSEEKRREEKSISFLQKRIRIRYND